MPDNKQRKEPPRGVIRSKSAAPRRVAKEAARASRIVAALERSQAATEELRALRAVRSGPAPAANQRSVQNGGHPSHTPSATGMRRTERAAAAKQRERTRVVTQAKTRERMRIVGILLAHSGVPLRTLMPFINDPRYDAAAVKVALSQRAPANATHRASRFAERASRYLEGSGTLGTKRPESGSFRERANAHLRANNLLQQ